MVTSIKKQEASTLSWEQKEALGLLSVGTFLEYFDLMLYVHMAVSCLVMANLPTYAQIGVTASWVVTLCRAAQGMSSMGEIVGAELYMTETTKAPIQYPVVTLISVFSILGTNFALGAAWFATSAVFNWRIAFWTGTVVALIGSVARTKLRETPEFVDASRKIKREIAERRKFQEELAHIPAYHERVRFRTAASLFLIQCGWPTCFYFTYIHCSNMLKHTFGFTPEQIIQQNFLVSIINLAGYIVITYLSYRVHPLQILRVKSRLFLIFVLCCPYLLLHLQSPRMVFFIQAFVMSFVLSCTGAMSIFLKHFPVFRRFTYANLIYALSRTTMSIITSLGLVYLVRYFNHWGVLMVMLPVTFGYMMGIAHFEELEREANKRKSVPL